jgi:hypothetical protein
MSAASEKQRKLCPVTIRWACDEVTRHVATGLTQTATPLNSMVPAGLDKREDQCSRWYVVFTTRCTHPQHPIQS